MLKFFKGSDDTATATDVPPEAPPQKPATLLVIQADKYDWSKLFEGVTLSDGRPIRVVQTGWDCMLVCSESKQPSRNPSSTPGEILVHIKPQADGTGARGTVKPDFVLVRNEVRGATHTEDHRNALFGLMYGGVKAVNTLKSIYMFMERPVIHAELVRIQQELGHAAFPLVEQSYFGSYREMMYTNSFPAVVKVGHAHAGFGKMRIKDHHDFEDFRSVMAMTDGKYCTAEPFHVGDYDLRIQKIGSHYRVFKRTDMSGNWKTNTGCSMVEELELTEEYKRWADEAAKMFGGLDILTVDALHEHETGKEVILEVNGTSSGLCPDTEDADNLHIRDLVLSRMNDHLVRPEPELEPEGEGEPTAQPEPESA